MSGLVVRPATAADAPAACAIVRQSISELCVDDHRGDRATIEAWLHNKTVANFVAWIASVEHVARIALDESGPQGFALLNRSGTVALLYVTPAARFRGVSKALLASVEHAAAELGLDELSLVSTSTALRFYTSCGYVAAGEPRSGFGVSASYPMAKRIRPS